MPAFRVMRINATTVSAKPVNSGRSRNTSRFSIFLSHNSAEEASSSSPVRILPRTKNQTIAWTASDMRTTVPDRNALSAPAALADGAVSPTTAAAVDGSTKGRVVSDNRYAKMLNTTPTASAESKKWNAVGAAMVLPGRAMSFSKYRPGTTTRTSTPHKIAITAYLIAATLVPY